VNWGAVIHMIVAFWWWGVDVCYVESGVSLLNGEHGQVFCNEFHISAMRWDSFVDQEAYPCMLLLWVGWPEVAASWAVCGDHILAMVWLLDCYDVNFRNLWIC